MSDWRPLGGRLAAWSCGQGPRLVFVHGFTQTANSWKPIAARFAADGYEAVVVDAPGHGESTNVRADLRQAADMLTTQCGFGVYVGYSLGGRLCMHAALMHPDLVRGLAMVGGSPGIADEGDRDARRAADDTLASHIIDIGVDAFLEEWLSQPMFADLVLDAEQRADRRRNSAQGLAGSLRHAGTGSQASLWQRLPELNMPILAIAGEYDLKFAGYARQIAASVANGRSLEVSAAGHAAHLQQPDQVVEALTTWLQQIKY